MAMIAPRVSISRGVAAGIPIPANSLIMQRACEKAGVNVEFHPIVSGGHGFGMGKPGTATQEWPQWFEAWLRKHNFLA